MSERFEHELSSRLERLTQHAPPADGWERLQAARRPRSRHPQWLAAAASVVGVAMILAVLWPEPEPLRMQTSPLTGLIAQSQALEAEWRLHKVRVGNATRRPQVARLEDGLSMIDVQLNAAEAGSAEELALWRNRVQLMSALVAATEPAGRTQVVAYEVPL